MRTLFFWGCSYCGVHEPPEELQELIECCLEDGQCDKCHTWCGPFLVVGPEDKVMKQYRKEQAKHAIHG
jgi:hypothetical protein